MHFSSVISVGWSDKMSQDNTMYRGHQANAAFAVQLVRKEVISGT